jgi:hypothetical protein
MAVSLADFGCNKLYTPDHRGCAHRRFFLKEVEMKLPSDRSFGLLFSAIFLALALYFRSDLDKLLTGALYTLVSAFIFVSLLDPRRLRPLNRLWMKFGLALGGIISPLVLGILFATVFVPIGILFRVIGRDELRLKVRPRRTHWKTREEQVQQNHSFKQQF